MPRAVILFALTTTLLVGCVYLPHTATTYDTDCEIYQRKMTLEQYQVASIAGCRNEGCAVLLAAMGLVSAATAVVSGSVVVAGNVVYWLEEKGQCLNRQPKQESPDNRSSTRDTGFPPARE